LKTIAQYLGMCIVRFLYSTTRDVTDYNFAALIYFTANAAAVGAERVDVQEPPLNKYKAKRARGRLSITMFIHNEIIYMRLQFMLYEQKWKCYNGRAGEARNVISAPLPTRVLVSLHERHFTGRFT